MDAMLPLRRLGRDRSLILIGLAGITAVAWIYLVAEAHRMTVGSMATTMHAMVAMRPWSAGEFGLRFVMWALMMVAMMVPTAAPVILVYAAVARKAAGQDSPVAPTFLLVAGYVATWVLFSVGAAAAQMGLDRAALLSPTMATKSPLLGSALLIAAGVYQFTPLKHACLEQCRAPAHFISRHWRSGTTGAFRMGLSLGTYCVGCCWVLMALLFVGGVMNLVWIAAIAIFVLAEKLVPFATAGGRVVGATMIVAGALSLTGFLTLS